ncbi:MAG TPA: prepilin-type N-terminal cleavage/methylation domain-containing protein [Planctomycetota bacterium]|nr:prepilin-type N-terminal cleavage/methylation domain-containing protein [Planctomycetota bacterium]
MIRSRGSKGFTLLEIILVLVIIGFFAAMIAPKLAGVADKADENVSSQNKRDIVSFTRVWQQEHTGLPNQLVDLVNETETGAAVPEVDNVDPDDGEETFSQEFISRMRPYLHTLNNAEVEELKKLGVKYVMALNDTEGSDGTTFADTATPMRKVAVAAGLQMLMVGAGANDATDTPAWTQGVSTAFGSYASLPGMSGIANGDIATTGGDHGNPEWMYRIIMGIGPDCSLVKDGTVSSAALNPGTGSKSTYRYYCMILPRLKATVNRLGTLPTTLTIVGDSGETKDVTINLPQEQWDFGVVGPDGKVWPAAKNDIWDITATK